MNNSKIIRVLLIAVGLLAVVSVGVFNGGFVGQTLASWNDRTSGGAIFSTDPTAIQGYARAYTTGASAEVPTQWVGGALESRMVTRESGSPGTRRVAVPELIFNRTGAVLPHLTLGLGTGAAPVSGCASYSASRAVPCVGPAVDGVFGQASATATEVGLGSTALSFRDRLSIGSVTTGAECRPTPGGIVAHTPTVSDLRIGGVRIGAAHEASPPRSGTKSFTTVVPELGFNPVIRGRWEVVSSATSNQAVSSIGLVLSFYESALRVTPTWTVALELARSECGLGVPTPAPRSLVPTMSLGTMMSAPRVAGATTGPCAPAAGNEPEAATFEEPENAEVSLAGPEGDSVRDSGDEPVECVATPSDPLIEDGVIGETEPRPERDDDTSTPSTPPESGVEAPADEDAAGNDDPDPATPSDAEPAPVEPIMPTPPAPTTGVEAPVPAPSGPTAPVSVRPGVPFSVITTDGDELATVTIEDVSRTAGCGIAVRLEIATSAEPARSLTGLSTRDFREVTADGGTAAVASPGPACDVGASLPSTFEPGGAYTGWIAFDLVGGGTSVMLRPGGTAGWIVSVPAPAPVTSTTPVPSVAPTTEPAVVGDDTVVESSPSVETAVEPEGADEE